jgi:hypothetical protein
MRKVTTRPELLAASDQEIEAAVELADPMVLRGLLYLQTGDENIASIRVASTTGALSDVVTVAEEGDIMLLRQRAAAFLRKYRDDGAPELNLNNNPRLNESIALTVGEAIPARDIDMWREDLALNPLARGLEWPSTPDAKQLEEFIQGLDEPQGRLLRQCPDGELLPHAQNRAGPSPAIRDTGRSHTRHLCLHRRLLQLNSVSLRHRLYQPDRDGAKSSLTLSIFSGEDHFRSQTSS